MNEKIKNYIDSKSIIDFNALKEMFKLFGKNNVLEYLELLLDDDSFDINNENNQKKFAAYLDYIATDEISNISNSDYYNSTIGVTNTYVDSVKAYLLQLSEESEVLPKEEEDRLCSIIYDGRDTEDNQFPIYILKSVNSYGVRKVLDFNLIYNVISRCKNSNDKDELLLLVRKAKNQNGEETLVYEYENKKYKELKSNLNINDTSSEITITPSELKEQLNRVIEYRKAFNSMIKHNLKLVVSIAKRYGSKGLEFTDLISEGNFGLIKAVEKYDVNKGNRFSTYATWWIRQSVTRAIADKSKLIRIPVHMMETINKIARAKIILENKLQREPNIYEIAEELEMPVSIIETAINYSINNTTVSLQTPVGEDKETTLADFIEDPNSDFYTQCENLDLRESLLSELNKFNERDAIILKLRFGFIDGTPHTLDDVGKIYGITRERVRQIEAKILRKLRMSKKLKDYFN